MSAKHNETQSGTVDNETQVYGAVPFDGAKWHSVRQIDGSEITTTCGERYTNGAKGVRLSPVGQRPSKPILTGRTICYACVRQGGPRQ